MNIQDLYAQYSNFTEYRNTKLHEADEQNTQKKLQIQELEIEKKQAALEYEKQINKLKSELVTTTDKNRLNQELNREKSELKDQLHSEIRRLYDQGEKPVGIAQHLGLSSTTLIYQAIRNKSVVPKQTQIDTTWHYFDNSAIHRYAVSDCGNYVKVHGVQSGYKILESDGLEFVEGDVSIKANRKRAETALAMFHGTFEGKYIEAENPYTDN